VDDSNRSTHTERVIRTVFKRMAIEDWFDSQQFEVDYDIGESGMKFLNFSELGVELKDLPIRYGYHKGSPELRQLIAEQYDGLSAENMIVTTGASEANFAIIASLVGSRDNVVVEHPNFPSLYEVPLSLEREVTFFNLTFDEKFKPNLTRLAQLLKKETRLVVLSHPNNPTGSTLSERQLREVVELVESRNAYLLMDETYRQLTFGKVLPAAACLSSRAISVTGMSKAYGLPGIRIGWAVADKPIVEALVAVREQLTICNSAIGEVIASAVLRIGSRILQRMRSELAANYEVLREWMMNQAQLEWVEPEGGVVCLPRMKGNLSTLELCRLLVKKYRTFTVPGYVFGMDQYLRLGFGGEEEELRQGLKRLGTALAEVKAH